LHAYHTRDIRKEPYHNSILSRPAAKAAFTRKYYGTAEAVPYKDWKVPKHTLKLPVFRS